MTEFAQTQHETRSVGSRLIGARALALLGIDGETPVTVVNDWHQGGAETYVTDFHAILDGQEKHLIAKACIKLGPLQAMEEWLARRQVLTKHGVQLPDLLAVDGAVLVEEYIDHDFQSAYALADTDKRIALEKHFIETFLKIHNAGFSPTSLHDLRSRGDDVVVIDVGEDLGGITAHTRSPDALLASAQQEFRNIISA